MRPVAIATLAFILLGTALLLADCGDPSQGAPRPGPISGERALEHVRRMVAFGPRPSASANLIRTRDYIESEVGKLGLTPVRDTFTFENAPGVTFHNVSAEIPASRPGEQRVLVLGSHYDTKLCKGHKEPWHNFEFVGANDGGSSSGLLLELARHFKAEPLP
ncbi:MAG: M28 family peptidase, partial [Planctomycetota bacterium]